MTSPQLCYTLREKLNLSSEIRGKTRMSTPATPLLTMVLFQVLTSIRQEVKKHPNWKGRSKLYFQIEGGSLLLAKEPTEIFFF